MSFVGKPPVLCLGSGMPEFVAEPIEQDYEFGQELSVQPHSKVRICQHKTTGHTFCCKTLSKSIIQASYIHREVEMMRRLSGHRCIVKLVSLYEDPDSVHIIMELCEGGDLLDIVNKKIKLKEGEAATVFKDIIEAIQHCHRNSVIHRDIKLENFFMSESGVKLGDFGHATIFKEDTVLCEPVGTLAYRAPEMIVPHGYSYSVDIWSAGVVLCGMLSGSLPFNGHNNHMLRLNILNGSLDLSTGVWPDISDSAKDIIRGMLRKNVHDRLSIDQILNLAPIPFKYEFQWTSLAESSNFLEKHVSRISEIRIVI
eukprot:Gb_06404 [translate_table: standard]